MNDRDDWKKDYPSFQELSEEELDENHSLKKMFSLVGENKQVVDFGCATGYFSQLITKKGCRVTGVEINPEAAEVAKQYCEQVIVADLDLVTISDILPEKTFDVAIFGDVLEHLKNPWQVLNETQKILKANGYVVASIPNIGHGAIRLALLQGEFEYTELGILDSTHLRFFTRKTVQELFERSGYFIDYIDYTKVPVFSESPLLPKLDRNTFENEIVERIEKDEQATTFQFIIKALPLSVEGNSVVFIEKYSQLVEQLASSQSQLQQTQAESASSQSQLHHTQAELASSQSQLHHTQAELANSQSQLQHTQAELASSQSQLQHQLQHTQAELASSQSQLQHTQAELASLQSQLQYTQAELASSQSQLQHTQAELASSQSQLQHTQAELASSQSQLQHTQVELEQLKATITAMETSKFWKLRTWWLKLKKFVLNQVFGK